MPLFVPDSATLVSISREVRARGVVYLLLDRHKEWLLLCQKLPIAAKFINSDVIGSRIERVNTTSLYEIANTTTIHKLRWRVRMVQLGEAVEQFERERREGYRNVLVLGAATRYKFSQNRALVTDLLSITSRSMPH